MKVISHALYMFSNTSTAPEMTTNGAAFVNLLLGQKLRRIYDAFPYKL